MKFDTRIILKDYKGEDVKTNEMVNGESILRPLNLFDTIDTALNSMVPNELQTPDDKKEIFKLSLKLYKDPKNPIIDLTPEEMVFIKNRVGLVWNSLVFGRVTELFDNPVHVEEVSTVEQSHPTQDKEG